MTKVLLLGDIGWPHLYHLGDEAMTEAAINMLTSRGVDDITLVSAVADVSAERYGLPAVERIGFASSWSRRGLEATLEKVTSALEDGFTGHEGVTAMIAAVAATDTVVIAGGGNMNSQYVHHLFERTALARIAAYLNKPLFVTSQTVGPLRSADEPLVAEILNAAVCFGARDRATCDLLLGLGGDPDRIVHTMDDAFLLAPQPEDSAYVEKLGLSQNRIVASIQPYAPDVGRNEKEYFERLAATFDELSQRYDADVALVPHAGSFDPNVPKDDVSVNDAIAELAKSGRIKPLAMSTARQVIALTGTAMFSLSTRYHPVVFGSATSTPAFALVSNQFASVRMRGALENVGLETYAVPVDAWLEGPFLEIVEGGLRRGFIEHASAVQAARLADQQAWWDALVSALRTGEWVRPDDLVEVESRSVSEAHAAFLVIETRLSERIGVAESAAAFARLDLSDATAAATRRADKAERERSVLVEQLVALEAANAHLSGANERLAGELSSQKEFVAQTRSHAATELATVRTELEASDARSRRLRRELERLRNRRVVRLADRLAALVNRG